MDIRQLQYFVEAARLGSFSKAAKSLYITQPTVSKMIRQIEEELGADLFYREGKSIKLTDAGEILLAKAQNIVESFHSLSSELDSLRNLKKGHIRIGLPPMVGANFFPAVIGQFHRKYPKVTIRLYEDGAKKVENDVENGILDIGMSVLPVDETKFHVFTFAEERLELLVPAGHRLVGRKAVSLAELKEEEFVLFQEDFALHDRVIDACVRAGFQPRVVYESTQWDLIAQMVAAGLGIALLPQTICRDMDRSRISILAMTDPVIPWQLGMIWRKGRYLSFAAREWIDFAQGLLKDKGDSGKKVDSST
ncbi:LysR family transcriptional regulator [Paenibacillus sp. HN-1]|uniref:cidABC operon transcriptional activator CidR n=1 Tax=Paenibacillus TaxID=44249 RepID=UPI001CA92CD8|nr:MULTISPECIES: LysR family transcriptional regulator [Paenibacillus]MBY9077728.1 LysR family transcriptional regulator [Paenibacillus sp. CGMCC 1.18879]MBY9083693.1 LysR family transcriptional regulator [Paenibacillus sinensis]